MLENYNKKIFLDGVLGLQYGTLNEILNIISQIVQRYNA